MSIRVSPIVADGVKVFDLLLVLGDVVAEAINVPWETHSKVYVTHECGGRCKSR